jgi:hypothetical protein
MSKIRNQLKASQRLVAIPAESVSITAESDALAGAVATWLNVQPWAGNATRGSYGSTDQTSIESYPEFELLIACDAAKTITVPKLYSCELLPVTIADDTFTSSGSSAVNTANSHLMQTGDGPFRLTTTDTLPAGLLEDTDYYVEDTGTNTFELYLTRDEAIASAGGIATTGTGTGTHTIADVQTADNPDDNTRRFHHALVGDLNEAGDIVLGVQTAYKERIKHSPLTRYYFVTATGETPETVTIRLTPVVGFEE